ncbi:metal ABC transporter permease [Helicobacter canis]|uniref:Metal ABC transporter permease n=1 Tax=Helicobacter canis NCTC 12740 TaxID=1357399 RepID=V8CH36_9HELI|nr:metal ABC transporter permease [Helicobacter canis]ETD26728.1 hypothetical protein HMPREF2087_01113 [Helicobacter canis NCTC 12740]
MLESLSPLFSVFMQNIAITALLLSVGAGLIGSLIVANKSVFLAGGVAHAAFGGVGVAVFFGCSVLLGALGAALAMALFLLYATLWHKGRLDTFIAIAWAFGMALGVVLIELTPGYKISMESYLFGALAFSTAEDIYALLCFDIVLVVFVSLFYREILCVLYDMEFSRLKRVSTKLFVSAIFILTAFGVVLGMRAGGLILVISMLSIPAYIAMMFARNLAMQFCLSIGVCLLCMCGGILISFVYDVALGACIVLVSVGVFVCALGLRFAVGFLHTKGVV